MSLVQRFGEYAAAFEKAFETEDWSLIEPYFTEDAVYETLADPPFGGRQEGRRTVVDFLKRSVDGFDRKFGSRELETLEGPEERDGAVWLRWRATYRTEGLPDLAMDGEETAFYEGDLISRLEDRFTSESTKRTTEYLATHGAKLG